MATHLQTFHSQLQPVSSGFVKSWPTEFSAGETRMAADMTIDQILRDLNYCDNEFPSAAWESALQSRTEIIPKLTEAIDDATSLIDDDQMVTTWGHVAALFLLAELDAGDAFPVILKSMCCSAPDDLYGGFISEDFPQIAARLAESPEEFSEVIDDPDVADSVRSALTVAVFGMVCEKRISRDKAILYLLDRMDVAADQEDVGVMTTCVEMLGQLHAHEAHGAVSLAVDAGLVDDEVLGIDYFEKQLARGQAAFDEPCSIYLERRSLSTPAYLQQLPAFSQELRHPQNLAEALREIQAPFDRLPADAIRWARKHGNEITPHLIRIIDEIAESCENESEGATAENEADDAFEEESDDERDQQGMGHIIALYLLTEFGVREALPAILRAVCHPDPQVSNCFQNVVSVDLAQILGRLADSPEQLNPIADDPELDEFLRQDAVDAVVWMVTEGKLDRAQAIELLQRRFQRCRDEGDRVLSTWLACALMDLGASSARESILDACESGELDEDYLWTAGIEEMLADDNQSFVNTCENSRRDRIEHTVVELNGWNWDVAQVEDLDSDEIWDDDDDDGGGADDDDDDSVDSEYRMMRQGRQQGVSHSELRQLLRKKSSMDFIGDADEDVPVSPDAATTIRNTEPKVGRNDPCPCGSGRKYKKCCANAEN